MAGAEAALACQRAEQRATGVRVGVMDQFASALGRRGHALLLDCGTLEYRLIRFPDELMIAVIDSGEHRNLARTPYNQRRREAEAGQPNRRRHVDSRSRAFMVCRRFERRDFEMLGTLLKESHQSLRDDFEVSTRTLMRWSRAWAAQVAMAPASWAPVSEAHPCPHRKGKRGGAPRRVGRPIIVRSTADGAFAQKAA
jgi:galactokinase